MTSETSLSSSTGMIPLLKSLILLILSIAVAVIGDVESLVEKVIKGAAIDGHKKGRKTRRYTSKDDDDKIDDDKDDDDEIKDDKADDDDRKEIRERETLLQRKSKLVLLWQRVAVEKTSDDNGEEEKEEKKCQSVKGDFILFIFMLYY